LHSRAEAESLQAKINFQTPYLKTAIFNHPEVEGGPFKWYSLKIAFAPGREDFFFANKGYWYKSPDLMGSQIINKHQFVNELCQMIAFWGGVAQLEAGMAALSDPNLSFEEGRQQKELAQKNAVVSFRFLDNQSKDNNNPRRTRKVCGDMAQEIFTATLLLPNL
jgi:hypothetical protein